MLLNVKQLCWELGISEATLRRWRRSRSDFPTAVALGPRRIAFRRDEVEQFAKTGSIHAKDGH
ncbi:MAG: helix-turn-helix transcriptional regulator [Neoaquamicrobium sediminum]|uniref:helix-turn-helix transcriptional regulator n=1 Tax=Neoaquamicrobium sediminum TaxID=1849104 RepID=UPI0040350F85